MWIENVPSDDLQSSEWSDLKANMHFRLQMRTPKSLFERAFHLLEPENSSDTAHFRILMQAEGKSMLFAECGTQKAASELWFWIQQTMMPRLVKFYSQNPHASPNEEIWDFLRKEVNEMHFNHAEPVSSIQADSCGIYSVDGNFCKTFNIYPPLKAVFCTFQVKCRVPLISGEFLGDFWIFQGFWCFSTCITTTHSTDLEKFSIFFPSHQIAAVTKAAREIIIAPLPAPKENFHFVFQNEQISESVSFLLSPGNSSSGHSPKNLHSFFSSLKGQNLWAFFAKHGILIKSEQIYRNFIRQGIPNPMRQFLWPLFASLSLMKGSLSQGEYTLLQAEIIDSCCASNRPAFKEIERDLQRALPGHEAFKNPQGIDSLRRVLQAFAFSHPELGYTQGMNIVAATLLLHMEEHAVYNLLLMIFIRILPDHCNKRLLGPLRNQKIFEFLLCERMPKIWKKLNSLHIEISMLTFPWFVCLFLSVLPSLDAAQLVDCFLWRGAILLHEVSLAVFAVNSKALLAAKDDDEVIGIVKGTFDKPCVLQRLLEASEKYRGIEREVERIEIILREKEMLSCASP